MSPLAREVDQLLAAGGVPLFTRPVFTGVLRDVFGFRFRYLLSRARNGEVRGAMPCFDLASVLCGRRLSTAPFNFFGGLHASDETAAHDLLVQARRAAVARRWVEMKLTAPLPQELVAEFGLAVRYDFLTFEVPLEGEGEMERRRHPRLRERLRALRRQLGRRLVVAAAARAEEVAAFHRLLTREYLRKHRMLPLPFALFRRVWQELGPAGGAEVLLARIDGRLAAGAFLLQDGDRVRYQWGAFELALGHESPLKLLLDEAMRRAVAQGKGFFDLGLTARTHAGLRFFKTRWGGVERALPWYYLLAPGERVPQLSYHSSFGAVRQALRWIPPPLLRLVPPGLFRHLA